MSIFKFNELETNSKSMGKQKGAIRKGNYQRKRAQSFPIQERKRNTLTHPGKHVKNTQGDDHGQGVRGQHLRCSCMGPYPYSTGLKRYTCGPRHNIHISPSHHLAHKSHHAHLPTMSIASNRAFNGTFNRPVYCNNIAQMGQILHWTDMGSSGFGRRPCIGLDQISQARLSLGSRRPTLFVMDPESTRNLLHPIRTSIIQRDILAFDRHVFLSFKTRPTYFMNAWKRKVSIPFNCGIWSVCRLKENTSVSQRCLHLGVPRELFGTKQFWPPQLRCSTRNSSRASLLLVPSRPAVLNMLQYTQSLHYVTQIRINIISFTCLTGKCYEQENGSCSSALALV